jgi:hypothetical protein
MGMGGEGLGGDCETSRSYVSTNYNLLGDYAVWFVNHGD